MEKPYSQKKPWLTASQQVKRLGDKGVRFNVMSADDARSYLEKNSNYFRIRSYRSGFAKVTEGPRKGQYANLDFAMLVDLSIIDMLLRNQLLPMTLDIEHFCKVKFLQQVEHAGEDGYAIVADFLRSQDCNTTGNQVTNHVKAEIEAEKHSPYCSYLIEQHPTYDYPVWEFIEVICFGTFCYFYKYAAKRFGRKDMEQEFYRLQAVRGMRNACAHNQTIINDMAAGEPRFHLDYAISKELAAIDGIGKSQRKSKMSNERLQQIVTTLFMHSHRASEGVINHRAQNLDAFIKRMNKNLSYYDGNTEVLSGFAFLTKVITAWYS